MPKATTPRRFYLHSTLKGKSTDAHVFLYWTARNITFFDIKFLPGGCKYIKISYIGAFIFQGSLTRKLLRSNMSFRKISSGDHLYVTRTQAMGFVDSIWAMIVSTIPGLNIPK